MVNDYQLSLAIGKEGQNARLAARLTGWKIDIKSKADFDNMSQEEIDQILELNEDNEESIIIDEDLKENPDLLTEKEASEDEQLIEEASDDLNDEEIDGVKSETLDQLYDGEDTLSNQVDVKENEFDEVYEDESDLIPHKEEDKADEDFK